MKGEPPPGLLDATLQRACREEGIGQDHPAMKELREALESTVEDIVGLFGRKWSTKKGHILMAPMGLIGIPIPLIDEVWPELMLRMVRMGISCIRPSVAIGTVIVPDRPALEGVLVKSASAIWTSVIRQLQADWRRAPQLHWRVWEELIAGAYKKAGFDEVILTSRSGDKGKDIIATRRGFGSVKVIGSVKAYAAGRLVTRAEVDELLGVVNRDRNASKGILTTTSDFAPKVMTDKELTAFMPHRLELINGLNLRDWLTKLLDA